MHNDERALLMERALMGLHPPRRTAILDGPLWWAGPIAIFAALAALLIAIPWPQPAPNAPAREEPSHRDAEAFASSRTRFSKN